MGIKPRNVLIAALMVFCCFGAECDEGRARDAIDKAAADTREALADAVEDTRAANDSVSDITQSVIGLGDAIDPIVKSLTPVFPWLEYLTIAGLGLRSWHTKRTAVRVTQAVTAATKEGKIDFNDTGTKIMLARMMGAAGKKLVDQSQGKKRGLPI